MAALVLPLIVSPSLLAVPAYAVTCQPGTSTPNDSYPGTVVKADNFESGTLSGYAVQTSGTGTVAVSSAQAHDGACSAYVHATTDTTSLANFSTQLPTGTQEVYADGWFDIAQAGVSGWDVPYFRFFSGSTRFVDVYRYDDNGQLWLRVLAPSGSFTFTRLLSSTIPLNTWHHVVIHVIPNGTATTVQVWFDGASVYSSNQVSTVASSVTSVMNGAEHYQQMEDTYIDDLVVKSVIPAPAPVASFTASPTSGIAPLNVAFTDTSTGSPTSWSWNFGDGGTSTSQNPTHTYASAGTYTATLTATNATGSNSTSSTITVSALQAPVASFKASPTSGAAPLNVAFTDTSTGSPTSWAWDFGDGATSTAQNPSHTYAAPGTYTAKLTATNAAGSNSTSSSIAVGKVQPTASTAQDMIPNDSLTLSGAANPTGTITFNLYSPNDTTCSLTPALTQTVQVTSGNGTYSTTNTTFHATTAGTWRWASSYSGDGNNQALNSACGAEAFTIANG
ncbi:PKD domain-containing protein [Sinomonas terrae]|uniref:PKD domain-containing protein n=1 Tax=Sinomonas terrae TaxID=2908838 RepID=A0ABS9U3Y7_9MICC|nr:PKD domain-containing protein [Sinomonas terrae]MCH6471365.1 PKD domain-containing protein [Sinomonas terrae]